MLDLRRLDLRSLAEALEDHSSETSWWFDPQSGEVEPRLDPLQIGEGEQEDPRDRDLVLIEPIPSREAYGDMEDFIGHVRDPRARDLLERAIAGARCVPPVQGHAAELPGSASGLVCVP